MSAVLRKVVAGPLEPLLRAAARSYVAGPELADATAVAQSLEWRGSASALCFWDGEDDAPRPIAERHLETLREIARLKLDSYVSLKAPSLAFDGALLGEIADEARGCGVGLHFDSLGPETAGRTFELIEAIRPRCDGLGCTLPGRWRRSVEDAGRAIRLGLNVRVVKGQWEEEGGGAAPEAGFLEVIEALAGRARKVAVATHDPALAGRAVRRLRRAGTSCEIELLYGLPSRAALAVAKTLAVPVRFYIPYGHAWLPYGLRQATRNPRILWWMVRDAWSAAVAR
jgi:proline dehydrogenase